MHSESVIDLVSSSAIAASGNPTPRSTFGSLVTVASLNPSNMTVNSGNQSFATTAWKPKEPPCFFGQSTEDAHTWVSLVRNYLTFMSNSDSQQVAYTVTLFREAAHEWYMSFERRNRGPPRDWAGWWLPSYTDLDLTFGPKRRSPISCPYHRGKGLCETVPVSLRHC